MSDDVCITCNGAQFVGKDVPVGHPDFAALEPCVCYEATLNSTRQARLLGDAALPPDQVTMTFESFDPSKVQSLPDLPLSMRGYYADRVRARKRASLNVDLVKHLREASSRALGFARRPQGFFTLIGEPGCGKTHLAAAVVNHCLTQGKAVCFAVVPDLLDHVRATFGRNGGGVTYSERFQAYKEIGLLILDDLGTESPTPWVDEKMYQLINHRYNFRLPTVVTSNELPTTLDPRLTSRLFGAEGTVFEILAGDFRMRRAA